MKAYSSRMEKFCELKLQTLPKEWAVGFVMFWNEVQLSL